MSGMGYKFIFWNFTWWLSESWLCSLKTDRLDMDRYGQKLISNLIDLERPKNYCEIYCTFNIENQNILSKLLIAVITYKFLTSSLVKLLQISNCCHGSELVRERPIKISINFLVLSLPKRQIQMVSAKQSHNWDWASCHCSAVSLRADIWSRSASSQLSLREWAPRV